jgi:hypothetical protein
MLRRTLLLAALAFAVSTQAAEKTEKKKGGGENFIQLPTLTTSVQRADRRLGVLTIEVGIDVPDAGLRKRAQESVPLLRDAFTREILTYAPTLGPGQAPNPDIISLQLQRAVDRILGRPGAKLLIGSILTN